MLVQLLGSDPACMAENAAQVAELSPVGIDLNFGCPAPTVNRHGGGATLLDDPEGLRQIVSAVRQAVPLAIPVSAKMRLGISHTDKALDCARALEAGGACSLVVHARTRDQGYRPPAYWEWVARVREAVQVPVIANGEVWTTETYALCRSITGCADVMIGRGAITDPFLAGRIKAGDKESADRSADWLEFQPLLAEFWRQVQLRVTPVQAPGRLKLWLSSLRLTFVEADALYLAVRPVRGVDEISRVLEQHGVPLLHATPLA